MQKVHAEGGIVGIAAVDFRHGPAGGEAFLRHFSVRRQEIAGKGWIRAVGVHLDLRRFTVRADHQGGRPLHAVGQPERKDRFPVHHGLVHVDGFGKRSFAVVGEILIDLAGTGMEGVSGIPQGDVHAAFDAPQVGQAHHDLLSFQDFIRVEGRNDEIARHHDIGPIDHDVIDGAVQRLGLRVDIIHERPGIDRPGRLPDRPFLVLVQHVLIVGELQDRAGERLGAAPAGGDFTAAGIGRALPVADLALDHRQGNEHQKRQHAHQGDLQRKGIFQFHIVFFSIFAQ